MHEASFWDPEKRDLHFNSLHFNSPWVSSFIQSSLHGMGDWLSFRKDFRKILGPQYISEGGRSQKSRWMAGNGDVVVLGCSFSHFDNTEENVVYFLYVIQQ